MYDCLFAFTVLVGLAHVAYILQPQCTTSETPNSVHKSPEDGNENSNKEAVLPPDQGFRKIHTQGDAAVSESPKLNQKGDSHFGSRDQHGVQDSGTGARDMEKRLPPGGGSIPFKQSSMLEQHEVPRDKEKLNNSAGKKSEAAKSTRLGANMNFDPLFNHTNDSKFRITIPFQKQKSDTDIIHNNDAMLRVLSPVQKANLSTRFGGEAHLKSTKFDNDSDSRTEEKHLPSECRFSILIYGGIKVIRRWTELLTLVAALKLQDDGDWSTEVSCDSCTLYLTLSNKPGNVRGKDAVVFGMSPFSLKVNMPTFRTYDFDPRQLLVFYGVETPLRMRKWIPDVGTLPNHVMWSYVSTAEIRIPYGTYKSGIPLDINRKSPSERVRAKRKIIAWMGSNCVKEVFWPRMDFVQKLQAYIPVDVYGKCGNLTYLPRMSAICQNLMGQYKFYLSLENAECYDYATEKFWETALAHEIVPVVYGAPKEYYVKNAPPNSFIYTLAILKLPSNSAPI